jgi:hypothetical protein
MVGPDTYYFYYNAVRVGIVCEHKRAKKTVWTWQCGFYPGARRSMNIARVKRQPLKSRVQSSNKHGRTICLVAHQRNSRRGTPIIAAREELELRQIGEGGGPVHGRTCGTNRRG